MVEKTLIKIHLENDTGLRHVSIETKTTQAIFCPFTSIDALRTWPEVTKKPGIYLLLGVDTDSQKTAYVGLSGNIQERVTTHHHKVKDEQYEWNEIIIFTNSDNNLNSAHAAYLEYELYKLISNGQYRVSQSKPTEKSLSRSDIEITIPTFVENIKTILTALGYHYLLEPLPKDNAIKSAKTGDELNTHLYLSTSSANSIGQKVADGFVVFKDSLANYNEAEKLKESVRQNRRVLLDEGALVPEGERLKFTRDVHFRSSAEAANVITGNSVNALVYWKDINGKSLKEIQSENLYLFED